MGIKRPGFALILTLVFMLSASVYAAESEIVKKFLDAIDSKDPLRMSAVIEENKDKIPAEIKTLVDEALLPQSTEEDRESKFYIAELLANGYKDITNNFEPLRDVKKAVFNSRLATPVPVRSTPVNGVHVIIAPEATEHAKNVFKPDNIIIKKGDTVRWENKDKDAHVLVAMPLISMGGIKPTRIEPGASFDYKFEKAGECYYMCYIHKGMIGKITVEE